MFNGAEAMRSSGTVPRKAARTSQRAEGLRLAAGNSGRLAEGIGQERPDPSAAGGHVRRSKRPLLWAGA